MHLTCKYVYQKWISTHIISRLFSWKSDVIIKKPEAAFVSGLPAYAVKSTFQVSFSFLEGAFLTDVYCNIFMYNYFILESNQRYVCDAKYIH